ncbi:NAD(P)-dependent oxidoreductase [Oscillatoria sp. HE19RPO]|uniref:NAD(P)-dependent oxidoreductase n=1 Tax=Oscillatoria sp. HE19RPO TaxID=2954806 RepID=UPI0020C2CAB3|nr:NAD(P)-dependent oxidoreductase [Oscillatoria sp. HE19RPO]
MNKMNRVCFIGTGAMGRPMIFKLLEKGYSVNVYDKYKQAAETVVAAGARWVDTPKEATRNCDVVITCLPLPHHVLENMLGENGAIEGMQAGTTWIDTSTTDYHNTKHIADVAAERGIYSLEAPLSNLSHMGVDFGNVSFYVSGDRRGYDLSKDVLEAMGQISFFVDENIGKAQTVKLLTNSLFYAAAIVLSEVFIIAQAHGIGLKWMWEFILASKGYSCVAEQFSPFIFDGSYDRSCTLEITVKDTDLTVKLADELNVAIPIGRIVEERYRQAGQQYDSQVGHMTISKLVEEENNLELRIPGYTAPSRYGANPNYVRSDVLVTDKYGRVKPFPYQLHYEKPPIVNIDTGSVELAELLTELMAYVNYVVLQEAYKLGKNMGLSLDLVTETIRWSCGKSWVFDNHQSYQPNPGIICQVKQMNLDINLKIPSLMKMMAVLEASAQQEVA